ncbi:MULTISPECIES: arsenic metallochaperone ArsD family protein [unclassified Granulicatella]|uniref:arsenic metallochaperone ArsD family protein n=1 Tax=unclassified Granulicatella TaxID=2630493 RepID=UPI001074712A|nr:MULTISPECIES: arsenic metallochaperone ArsD family protein [unclassified Granulicatella]MBF0780825.1 arsenic metallochaperone ArsD family protein [Granulicatella sp. 19428wC4_WM01]TFU93532.1 arsenic metallochaperone ArsD family protein [Granulicatella sp. WM01]
MKIEVFDRVMSVKDENEKREFGRVRLILEGLGSLEGIETTYNVHGEDEFPEYVINVLHQEGLSVLPLTYLDSELVKKSEYLTNDEFIELTGVSFVIEDEEHLGKNHIHEHGECSCGHHH